MTHDRCKLIKPLKVEIIRDRFQQSVQRCFRNRFAFDVSQLKLVLLKTPMDKRNQVIVGNSKRDLVSPIFSFELIERHRDFSSLLKRPISDHNLALVKLDVKLFPLIWRDTTVLIKEVLIRLVSVDENLNFAGNLRDHFAQRSVKIDSCQNENVTIGTAFVFANRLKSIKLAVRQIHPRKILKIISLNHIESLPAFQTVKEINRFTCGDDICEGMTLSSKLTVQPTHQLGPIQIERVGIALRFRAE